MNMALEFSTVSKSAHLTPEQTEEFGRRVEQIRQDVMQSLGEKTQNISTKFVILFDIPKSHRVAC